MVFSFPSVQYKGCLLRCAWPDRLRKQPFSSPEHDSATNGGGHKPYPGKNGGIYAAENPGGGQIGNAGVYYCVGNGIVGFCFDGIRGCDIQRLFQTVIPLGGLQLGQAIQIPLSVFEYPGTQVVKQCFSVFLGNCCHGAKFCIQSIAFAVIDDRSLVILQQSLQLELCPRQRMPAGVHLLHDQLGRGQIDLHLYTVRNHQAAAGGRPAVYIVVQIKLRDRR